MSDQEAPERRVRFYGPDDFATGLYVSRVASLAEAFDPSSAPFATTDILELFNVQKYLECGILPESYSEEERDRILRKIPQMRSIVARHFSTIKDADLLEKLTGVEQEYLSDLVDLLGRNKVFEHCSGEIMIPALRATGVHLGLMLASKKLVYAYDAQVRDELIASPQGAEYLVRKHLQHGVSQEIILPPSLTPVDSRALLESYIDSESAHLGYVELIWTGRDGVQIGIDAKLRLRAKRRHVEMATQLLKTAIKIRTGYGVEVSESQAEPVKFEIDRSDGLLALYTYGIHWLDATLDRPSILNNFQHLFEFSNRRVLLNLPSYTAELGPMERFLGMRGKSHYVVGIAFRAEDSATLLQTQMYVEFLRRKGLLLEEVISWFFETYLNDEFGALNFSFTPSGGGTSYLQKVRHLFAEMESVANQFTLFARDGELDRELLAMGAEQVRYKSIPSLLKGKYLYSSGSEEITTILHLLFSDQSMLTDISECLKACNAMRLIVDNHVTYADFRDYQRASIDFLIAAGVLENTGDRVQFVNLCQLVILESLFEKEADSYYRLTVSQRAEADRMVDRGWIDRRGSLLTEAEGAYFNYFLNSVDFSNGPDLRNRYLHGSQANATDENSHYEEYIVALRLTVALAIKMNDDFCLWAEEKRHEDGFEECPVSTAGGSRGDVDRAHSCSQGPNGI